MAKDQFSFDIVSEVSMPEVTNAVDQASREIAQRFDFKNTGTSMSQDATLIEIRSSTEDRLKAAVDVLKDKAVKRGNVLWWTPANVLRRTTDQKVGGSNPSERTDVSQV